MKKEEKQREDEKKKWAQSLSLSVFLERSKANKSNEARWRSRCSHGPISENLCGARGGGEGDTLRTAIFCLNIAREDSKTTRCACILVTRSNSACDRPRRAVTLLVGVLENRQSGFTLAQKRFLIAELLLPSGRYHLLHLAKYQPILFAFSHFPTACTEILHTRCVFCLRDSTRFFSTLRLNELFPTNRIRVYTGAK